MQFSYIFCSICVYMFTLTQHPKIPTKKSTNKEEKNKRKNTYKQKTGKIKRKRGGLGHIGNGLQPIKKLTVQICGQTKKTSPKQLATVQKKNTNLQAKING